MAFLTLSNKLKISNLIWVVRWFLLNMSQNVDISRNIYLARSAKILRRPDGFSGGGRVVVASGVRICDGAIIAPYLKDGWVAIGENTYIGPYCVLYGHGGLTIGKNCLIATHTVIIPSNHSFIDPEQLIRFQTGVSLGITIGDDVWIGAGVKILDGVQIGDGCVIGAGAVVTKSLEPYSVASGVPARIVGSRKKD